MGVILEDQVLPKGRQAPAPSSDSRQTEVQRWGRVSFSGYSLLGDGPQTPQREETPGDSVEAAEALANPCSLVQETRGEAFSLSTIENTALRTV